MKARVSLRGLLGASGAIAVASLARADAPTNQYGTFGPSEVVINDNHTGLNWQRQVSSQQFRFVAAADYCATLSLGPFASGWRVPSYKELLTLVDDTPNLAGPYGISGGASVYKRIDASAFGLVNGEDQTYTPIDSYYWTSSVSPLDPTQAYAVDFGSGQGSFQLIGNGGLYVRCVHDCTGVGCP